MAELAIRTVENERAQLGPRNELTDFSLTGTVFVDNPSQSRVWTLVLKASNVGKTDLPSEFKIAGINPNSSWSHMYKGTAIAKPMLDVREIVDTNSDIAERVNEAFILNRKAEMKYKITIKNVVSQPVRVVSLKKEVPEFAREIRPVAPKGKTRVEGHTVFWEDFELAPEEEVALEIVALAYVTTVDPVSVGKLVVEYEGNFDRTEVAYELIGKTEVEDIMDAYEGAKPGTWDAELEIINHSGISITVFRGGLFYEPVAGKKETIFDEHPNAVLGTEESWKMKGTAVCKDRPKLMKEVEYSVNSKRVMKITGVIEKTPLVLPVLKVDVDEVFEPPQVDAYTKTEVMGVVTVKNSGSADVGKVQLSIELPKDIKPPEFVSVSADIDGTPVPGDNISYVLEPNDLNPEVIHKLTITLQKLQEFRAGRNLHVKLPLVAWNPEPKDYPMPLEAKVWAVIEGLDFSTKPPAVPTLLIRYAKRNIRVSKMYTPGATSSQFVVTIRVTNRGEVPIENVVVNHWVQTGFKVVAVDEPAPTIESEADGRQKLTWRIATLGAGQQAKLGYTIEGAGELQEIEPTVS
ncbi:MAG: hypothetical protein QXL15_05070 [Candidatus Korarchaeota archaeon]